MIESKASTIPLPVLSRRGIDHAYFLNKSMMLRRYLTPLLYFEKDCMLTRSADYVSSAPPTLTRFVGHRRFAGLWSSSASWSVYTTVSYLNLSCQVDASLFGSTTKYPFEYWPDMCYMSYNSTQSTTIDFFPRHESGFIVFTHQAR